MVLYQVANHGLYLRAVNLDGFLQMLFCCCRRTHSRLLTGIELRVHDDTVLEIVDAHRGGFSEANGAEMAGQLQSVGVRALDCCAELFRLDRHVSLERS